jgi:hypothetical protein
MVVAVAVVIVVAVIAVVAAAVAVVAVAVVVVAAVVAVAAAVAVVVVVTVAAATVIMTTMAEIVTIRPKNHFLASFISFMGMSWLILPHNLSSPPAKLVSKNSNFFLSKFLRFFKHIK